MTKKPRRVPDPQNPDQPESARPELEAPLNDALAADAATNSEAAIVKNRPVASADAVIAAEAEAAAASDTFEQASDGLSGTESENTEGEEEPAPEPPAELKRLQKILAQSGIASRRHAEELITQGRVQVNGKVVTELGSKADAHRDHIRVDGKLIHGSERQRYFMLNKPKGYVTTVSDPEGRPTIMEFFSKTRERLYPVGRLDYLSEGLLLVTNDGELANKLTRAASGVEKTYLVKVSGQPTEEALDRLREGVAIAKGAPASGPVQTAPAQIQPFRPGKPGGKRGPSRPVDNPWYEVVLIEGRNRELRKMFEEIGHHVEKIRRVGYGPLVLDLEPGKIRELSPEEVEDLRKAAEGKYRKPKPREPRKREFGQRSERPASKPRWNERRSEPRKAGLTSSRPDRGPFRRSQQGFAQRPESGGGTRHPERKEFRSEPRREFRPDTRSSPRFAAGRPQRPARREQGDRPYGGPRENQGGFAQERPRDRAAKPAWSNKPERGSRPLRFDREATPGSSAPRPNRFQRPDRSSAPRPASEFRPKRTEPGSPQRFGGKRPVVSENFPVRKRLEIRPAEESFEGQPTNAPDRQNRRPFPPRSGSRPRQGRGPSTPRTTERRSPQLNPDRPQRAEQRPSFNRDREQRPRFDRTAPAGTQRREGHTQDQDRPKRTSRTQSGPRPGGFGRPGPSRGKPTGSKQGTGRSAVGRRPTSRPGGRPGGGKSGGRTGGKRRP
jgi:23S rRNA pseudouridine2605 synthase